MQSHGHRCKIAISATSCLCHDQRILKISETLAGMGCDITLAGRKRREFKWEEIPFKTVLFPMFFEKGFLFYKFFSIRLFLYLLFHRFDLLVANDLDTLLPNFLVSKIRNIPLVYDSHEYFTGVPEIQNRPAVKWVWHSIERLMFPGLKYVMTVSDSVARKYESEYGVKILTVRNCSRKTDHILPYSKAELGITETDLLLILQGTGINIDRGSEELLGALSQTENVSLLIVGSGDVIDRLKSMSGELNISDRVKFIPVLKWDEMIRYTKSADAGLSLDKNTNPNYLCSLPNKLFDYISSGIPLIVSDLPEVSAIVREAGCGLIIESVTPENISGAITRLKDDPKEREEFRKKSVSASNTLNWERESAKLAEFYKKVFNESHL
jgi:glycosyltransferase involved in cell wall biosynthesis